VSEDIRQNLDNQKKTFIQPFFATIQLVMAGNDTEGLRYGVIETLEKYYLAWKNVDIVETQDFASPHHYPQTQDLAVNQTQDLAVNQTQDLASLPSPLNRQSSLTPGRKKSAATVNTLACGRRRRAC